MIGHLLTGDGSHARSARSTQVFEFLIRSSPERSAGAGRGTVFPIAIMARMLKAYPNPAFTLGGSRRHWRT
jgi:hypothetical protein